MGVFFSGEELVRIAVQNEETGYAFYRKAEENAKTEPLRSLFRYLAEQEKVHKEKFLKLKDAVKNPSRSDSSPVWEEINLFIKAMTDSHLFSGVGKNINLSVRSSDEKSAVDYAIGFEKDTLLFFYQMVDLVRPVDQPMVKTVINEEKEHIRKLVAIREELT